MPAEVQEFSASGPLHEALQSLARLGEAELLLRSADGENDPAQLCHSSRVSIRYQGQAVGEVRASEGVDQAVPITARSMLEYALDRETAVRDLADQLCTDYEELNMLYALLPDISTKTTEREIGETLVDKAAELLSCRRVSILILDESRTKFSVLASRGLPEHVEQMPISVADSVAGYALSDEVRMICADIRAHPDLAALSKGMYNTRSFALIRVPMHARGEPVGILAVTDRIDGKEFTARDIKLLEGLSATGASALMHCRLHTAIQQQMLGTIRALACAVDAKDHYTHDHSDRVARLCVATARELGVTDEKQLRKIELAGLMHDIGKIGIPDSILSKTDRLTPEEYSVITTHVEIGAQIVEKVNGLDEVADAIYHHHERQDGQGYPEGLCGDDIPLASRLIAVVDTYDSITTDRPYRKAAGADEAFQELEHCSGTQFDPSVINALRVVMDREARCSSEMTSTHAACVV